MPWRKLIPAPLKNAAKRILYRGDRFHCNCCGSDLKLLLTSGADLPVFREKKIVGGGKRENVCPVCFSMDRERLLMLWLEEIYRIRERDAIRVLHIAPEPHLFRMLSRLKGITYVCGDKFTEGYHYPQQVKDMDVTSLPFDDEHFDLILCNHVLEHVPDDRKAMREILRVLKPGGQAVLQVPLAFACEQTEEDPDITDPKVREARYGQFDHVRLYGRDYATRLREAGFLLSKQNLGKDNPANLKLGIEKEEDLYVVTRA